MTPIFNPLRDKAELLNTHAQPYQHAFDQIADTITFANLSECPVCHSGEYIDYIQTANEPEHGTYGIAIGCTDCQIQTTDQHWFISSPHSALSALNAAIELWSRRPDQAIAKDAEAVTSTEPVIPAQAGIQQNADRRDRYNPESKVTMPVNTYIALQQDAARYQWLKARFHAAETYYGDGCINALIFAAPEDSGLTVDLDQTIDNSIAATQKPEAAK